MNVFATVRLYSRNAYNWTVRLAVIAAAAELIKNGCNILWQQLFLLLNSREKGLPANFFTAETDLNRRRRTGTMQKSFGSQSKKQTDCRP